MRHIHTIILTALSLLCLASCQRSTDDRPVLCVSIEPQRWLLDQLVGDHYQTVAILPNGANPETYDPSMAARRQSADAKVIFTTGQLPYESVVTQSVKPGTLVVNTSEGITPLTGTHGHDGHNHDVDPHVWTSVANARIMAANMLSTLKQIDPDNAGDYDANYAALSQRLDSIDNAIAAKIKSSGVHAFAVWHPSLSYFAHDYGLHQVAMGQEHKEASVQGMKRAIEEARDDSVKVFFFQKEYDSRQAQSVNSELGARMVDINPLAYDWDVQLITIADELTK